MKKTAIMTSAVLISLGLTGCGDKYKTENKSVVKIKSIPNIQEESLDSKFKKVETLAYAMPKNGMKEVQKLFPDLTLVKNISKDDSENLSSGMSEESWMYSAENDVTVVVCKMMNTPAHIFKGKSMSEDELSNVKNMMMKMMNDKDMDMDEMEDMKMMDHKEIEKIDLAGYSDFSQEKFETLKGKQKFMVFFYANWCGTCRAWEKKLKANLATLPTNTIVLKADYDNDTELKNKFGVTTQSTGVFFDAEGNISELVGDPSMEKVKSFFQ